MSPHEPRQLSDWPSGDPTGWRRWAGDAWALVWICGALLGAAVESAWRAFRDHQRRRAAARYDHDDAHPFHVPACEECRDRDL